MGKSISLTEEEKAQAKVLLASGLTANAVGKKMNRDPKTVRGYAKDAQGEIENIQEHLAIMFEGISMEMLRSITMDDILKLDAYKRTLSASIAVDKARLIKGMATVNAAVLISASIDAASLDDDL